MAKGPSIAILREHIESLCWEEKAIIAVSGNTKLDNEKMLRRKVIAFKSWG